MAVYIKLLGQASVQQFGTELYTVPAGKCAVIQTISLVNARWPSSVGCNIYLITSTHTQQLSDLNVGLANGDQLVLNDIFTLGAGDKIKVDASEHLMVDAVVCGVERDAF